MPEAAGTQRPQPAREPAELGVVGEPPGEHARRVVEGEVACDEEQQPGNDGEVDADPARPQTSFPSFVTGTRAPHEQTRLRTAHSIFSRRPHVGQPR